MTTITHRSELEREAESDIGGGDRFVAGALLTLALLMVAFQVLAGEVIPPLAVFTGLAAGLAAVVGRRASRWSLIAAIVLTLAHLLGSIPFARVSLAHPETPATFLSDAFIGLAALTALIGAVAGLRGARPGSRRPLAAGAGVLAVAAVVVSVVAASGVESDARQAGDVPVHTEDVGFPDLLEVPAGGAVLWIDNQDPFHHTLVVEGTDLHQSLPGSAAVRMDVDLPPGEYRYFCDVPGHDGMEGELVAR